jgi:DNA-binding transcriptional regulator YhcF (GntR family)
MLKIQSIVDNVRKYLLGRILHGELHPGQQVKEQEIASSLGISRPPIREALKLLEAEGLIVRKPNRGAFVATITERDAWEIYTLKCSLYEMATRWKNASCLNLLMSSGISPSIRNFMTLCFRSPAISVFERSLKCFTIR